MQTKKPLWLHSLEIVDYVLKWWNGRDTIEKKGKYTAEKIYYECGNIEVEVRTPEGFTHTAFVLHRKDKNVWWKHDEDMYHCWQWNQYHYSGILPVKDLTKKKLYNMMLKQRRALEHSTML